MTRPATTMRAIQDSAKRFWTRSNVPSRKSWNILKPHRSLIPQRLDGIEPGGFAGRIKTEKDSDGPGKGQR